MDIYIVIDVGCLDCNAVTTILSIHSTATMAAAMATEWLDRKLVADKSPLRAVHDPRAPNCFLAAEYFDGYQHRVEVHRVGPPE